MIDQFYFIVFKKAVFQTQSKKRGKKTIEGDDVKMFAIRICTIS